jgi:hypothetical protein
LPSTACAQSALDGDRKHGRAALAAKRNAAAGAGISFSDNRETTFLGRYPYIWVYCALWVVSIALIDSYAEHRRGVLGEGPVVKGGVKGNHRGGAKGSQ